MELKNPGDFVRYCQAQPEDERLPQQVIYATSLADTSEAVRIQYGGHGESMVDHIDRAFRGPELKSVHPHPDEETLQKTHEILTNFWKYGESFDKWFKSKVIIVQN